MADSEVDEVLEALRAEVARMDRDNKVPAWTLGEHLLRMQHLVQEAARAYLGRNLQWDDVDGELSPEALRLVLQATAFGVHCLQTYRHTSSG